MKFLSHELNGSLYQDIKSTKNQRVEAIRPHLYKHNSPSGSVKIVVRDENNKLVAQSESIVITNISEATYFHGYVRFYINVYFRKNTTYRIYLESTGYSYSDSNYIAWVSDEGLNKYSASYTPDTPMQNPLDMEVWTRED